MTEPRRPLSELLLGVDVVEMRGNADLLISEIAFDSRKVVPSSTYVAIPGTQVDGHKFIDAAVSAGAKAIVCERMPSTPQSGTTYVQVKRARKALGIMAANRFGHPSTKLRLVGVTGTNGKTTIATLLYRVSRALGNQTGLFSTIHNEINGRPIPATHTTPDPLQLNRLMSEMVESGCTLCFMEVTSHAIHQDRIAGLNFTGALFTNLSHDHLDYHKTLTEYFRVKKSFFDSLPPNAFALTNKDDPKGLAILEHSAALPKTYALNREADYRVEMGEMSLSGLRLKIGRTSIESRLIGGFNAYNLAAVWGACDQLGFPLEQVKLALQKLEPVPGRFQWTLSSADVLGVVDFAHTPDALENVLKTAREIRPNGNLVTVFGCGGNKDREKRPYMGRIAAELSDLVVLTNDNPRREDPVKILCEISKGIPPENHDRQVQVISDRFLAIRAACERARKGDTVVVAGRGHEPEQELYGEKRELADIEVLRSVLNESLVARGHE